MSHLITIFPYKLNDSWVFDDNIHQISQESFVDGSDKIIDQLTINFSPPSDKFKLVFSSSSFSNYDALLCWESSEYEGNWYSGYINGFIMRGWLCSVLNFYFEKPPLCIYIKVSTV
jgi:hypothetical protein